ncbi:MAG: hypothetical protein PSX71_05630 [bacterium]|nr:hypothetical protein [bacterium]
MNNQDKDLHDDNISELYRQLPDVQPSQDSDALIRASARRAANAGPQKKYPSFGLKKFTATAAVLMLGVGLLLQWQRHEPEKLQEALGGKPAAPMLPTAAVEAAAKNRSAKTGIPETVQEDKTPAMTAPASLPAPARPAPMAIASDREVAAARNEAAAPAQDMPERAAREKTASLAMEKSDRREAETVRTASAQDAAAAGLMQERKREAPAATAAAPLMTSVDYRIAMSHGDYAQALSALQNLAGADADAALVVDRDMLRMLQGNKENPACARLSEEKTGREKPLCDLLGQRIKEGVSATRPEKLSAFINGEKAYRRRALEALFTPGQ